MTVGMPRQTDGHTESADANRTGLYLQRNLLHKTREFHLERQREKPKRSGCRVSIYNSQKRDDSDLYKLKPNHKRKNNNPLSARWCELMKSQGRPRVTAFTTWNQLKAFWSASSLPLVSLKQRSKRTKLTFQTLFEAIS